MVLKTTSKILFYGSTIYILLCYVFNVILENSNLEFEDGGRLFEKLLVFGIPIAMLLTLFGMGMNNKFRNTTLVVFRVIMTGIISLLVFFALMLTIAFDFCSRSYSDPYFKLKEDTSVVIKKSSFGCGAVDSTGPSISMVKIKKYPLGLIYRTSIDTSEIDESKWIRIENQTCEKKY